LNTSVPLDHERAGLSSRYGSRSGPETGQLR
jgi:hypothetical protein